MLISGSLMVWTESDSSAIFLTDQTGPRQMLTARILPQTLEANKPRLAAAARLGFFHQSYGKDRWRIYASDVSEC